MGACSLRDVVHATDRLYLVFEYLHCDLKYFSDHNQLDLQRIKVCPPAPPLRSTAPKCAPRPQGQFRRHARKMD